MEADPVDSDRPLQAPCAEKITSHRRPRILILGGTSEGSELAARLADRKDLQAITSLAGRVSQPRVPPGKVRVGGFGGAAGLIAYLQDEKIDVVIDATHPFAAKISGSAELACTTLNLPLIAVERPPWKPEELDRWRPAPDAQAAAAMVNHAGNRVFLAIGRQELGAFSHCGQAWFLVRAIDEPQVELPANSKLILDRGPFRLPDELRMLSGESINLVVCRNSGGAATYAKIEAARALRIPVVMIDRPRKHGIPTVARPDDALQKLAEIL